MLERLCGFKEGKEMDKIYFLWSYVSNIRYISIFCIFNFLSIKIFIFLGGGLTGGGGGEGGIGDELGEGDSLD